MKNVMMHMSTHPRLLKDVLTQYKSTFVALKELINNSIQANAKRIEINLLPTDCDEDSINFHPIDSIQVIDDGDGIPYSQFHERIMKVATDNKAGGLGIGRFGALQIGRTMSINTVGYEAEAKKYTTTSIVLETSLFQNGELQELEIPCNTSAFIFLTFHRMSFFSSNSLNGKRLLSVVARFLTVSASTSANEYPPTPSTDGSSAL